MPKINKNSHKNSAWVVSVTMGYGHDRAAYPLKHLAYQNEIVRSDNFAGIYKKDKKIWKKSRLFYEFISRFKNIPLLGDPAFWLFEGWQRS